MLELVLFTALPTVAAYLGHEISSTNSADVSKIAVIRQESSRSYIVSGDDDGTTSDTRNRYFSKLVQAQGRLGASGYRRMKQEQEAKWLARINEIHGAPNAVRAYYRSDGLNFEDITISAPGATGYGGENEGRH